MSQAVTRSSAAADAAALDRADHRKARLVEGVEAAISLRSDSWKASALAGRGGGEHRVARWRRRRAPCRRGSACRSTTAPARASRRRRPARCTASRIAGKNAGVIVFMRSGRLSCRWATPLSCDEVEEVARSWCCVHGGGEVRAWTTHADRETRDGLTLRVPQWPRGAGARHDCPRARPGRAHRTLRARRRVLQRPRLARRRLRPSRPRPQRRRARPARRRRRPRCVDLARVIDAVRARACRGPLVLLGHSLGGLVAARFVADGLAPSAALVAAGRRAGAVARRRSTPA